MVQQQPEIQLYDLYDIWYEPLLQQWWCKVLLIVGSCLCITACIWFLYKKLSTKKMLPPWQRALRSFEQLHTDAYLQAEKSQEFYLQLSAILKEYLQDRFQVAVRDKTDHELIEFFQHDEILQRFTADIGQVFEGASYVKFAQQAAALETMKRDLATCSSLVEQTKPPATT